jgi:hypothetical protein
MKYNELKYVDESFLDSRIKYYEYLLIGNTMLHDHPFHIILNELREQKSKLIDATPILKETWNAAKEPYKTNDYGTSGFESLGEFLETEVKL